MHALMQCHDFLFVGNLGSIEMKAEEEATVTRVGRSGIYVVPKGETGKLTLEQEGAQKNDGAATERVFLGDAVVVCGTRKKTLVLLPAGQTWFQWAEGQKAREELRALELQSLGGHALDEEQSKRAEELRVQVVASQEARAAAAHKAVREAEALGAADSAADSAKSERSSRQKPAGTAAVGAGEDKGTSKGEEKESGLPPPPPRDVHQILGEKPPDFPEGACGRMPRPPRECDMIKANLEVLSRLQEGEKLWVDLDNDQITAQRGGGFSRMLGRQGRAVTAAWATRFHGRVRAFVEKEIVQLECGRGDASHIQDLSQSLGSGAKGLEELRRVYTGDTATQAVLGKGVKEMTLTAKMCASYLARMRGEQVSGLVT
jgi:hypothetical protein